MCYINNLTLIVEIRKLEVRYICLEMKYRYKVDSNSINYIGILNLVQMSKMKLQKAPVTNCHYNQIKFPRLDNMNINFC